MSSQHGQCAIPSKQPASTGPVNQPATNVLECVEAHFSNRSEIPWWRGEITHPNCSREAIFKRDNYRCVYCGKKLIRPDLRSIDHVIPKCRFNSDGEANQDANRVACCIRCNRLKRHWHPDPLDPAWSNRDHMIKAARRHIARIRADRSRRVCNSTGLSQHPPTMHHRSSPLGVIVFTLCGVFTLLRADTSNTGAPPDDWCGLKAEATTLGKPAWR